MVALRKIRVKGIIGGKESNAWEGSKSAFGQIMVVNTGVRLKIIAEHMASGLRKVCLNPSCQVTKIFVGWGNENCSLLDQPFFPLQFPWMVTFHKEFWRGKMYLTVTQMCSAAGHLFIFLRMKNPSLMTRLNSGSSWVMIMYMNNLATGYGIQFLHLQFMMITGEMNQKLKMMQLMMRLLLMKIFINKHKLNRYLQLHHHRLQSEDPP